MKATIARFSAKSPSEAVVEAITRDGAAIIEGLLTREALSRVNEEIEGAIAAAEPGRAVFSPVMQAFHGPETRHVEGAAGVSRTFASEVMCHPMLLEICDRILLPACAQYQLNLGQILQRGPGAGEQRLHRDEVIWSDLPRPHPEIQVASMIALVDFTAANGATRIVPGSHRDPERWLAPVEQMRRAPPPDRIVCAEMPAGSAVVYSGGTIHAGGANATQTPRRGAHLSYCAGWLRTEENNVLAVPPAIAARLPRRAQELLGYGMYNGMGRGGGYLGMVDLRDPIELLAEGRLGR